MEKVISNLVNILAIILVAGVGISYTNHTSLNATDSIYKSNKSISVDKFNLEKIDKHVKVVVRIFILNGGFGAQQTKEDVSSTRSKKQVAVADFNSSRSNKGY